MTRHQRRKLAKSRQTDKLVSLASAEIARRNALIVSVNMSNPVRPGRSTCRTVDPVSSACGTRARVFGEARTAVAPIPFVPASRVRKDASEELAKISRLRAVKAGVYL